MPNLREKIWTTTTPANVEDAQYWEDHLISDEDAAKIGTVILPAGGTAGQVLTKLSASPNDAGWDDPASSGHTIEDADGVVMPYQSTLQFVSAEVTNDSTNNKTIVDCKGEKGDAATVDAGTVTTLPAGSSATVVNSGTTSDAVFDFGIPRGADGTDGSDGADGISPEITITTITGGHRVTITDADHPSGQSFDVMDGQGSGDMQASTYDANGDVANAGGIAEYVDDAIGDFIVANPTGAATGTLTKLGIGSDIYDIQGGGGGLPDGSTVTPTNDIQTWLACAGLTETYTTLNEVLADDDVMEKLFRSENASDYLVRSTTWANDITTNQTAMILIGANDYCANKLLEDNTWGAAISASTYWDKVLSGLVPNMTSNTTPNGEVFVSSQYVGYPVWQIFDGDDATLGTWVNAVNGYSGYKFPTAVCIKKVHVIVGGSTYTDTFKIQGSNDNSTYTDISGGQFTCVSGTSAYNLNLTNNTKYQYYRILQVTKNTGNSGIGCRTLQFYGRASQTTTIYSAANDIVSFVDDEGAKVVTTDSTGKGEVTIVCKPNTDITFTSSVAKNPDNLSENYSKVVTVKSSAEPVYVMPNNVCYWYGYKSSNLEDISTANGWTGSTFIAPTYNTNSIRLSSSAGKLSGIGNKNAITGIVALRAICKGDTIAGVHYGMIASNASKNTNGAPQYTTITENVITYKEIQASNSYVFADCESGRESDIYALWYDDGSDDGNYDKADADLIAPVQKSLTAKKAYAVGEQFVYNQTLYKVKQAIAQGAQITIGTNAVLAGCVTEQINQPVEYYTTASTLDISVDLDKYRFIGVTWVNNQNWPNVTNIGAFGPLQIVPIHLFKTINPNTVKLTTTMGGYAGSANIYRIDNNNIKLTKENNSDYWVLAVAYLIK